MTRFHIKTGEDIQGPLTTEEIVALSKARIISPQARWAEEGSENWNHISKFPFPITETSAGPRATGRTALCQDCDGIVSKRADVCPHCGLVFYAFWSRVFLIIIFSALILFVINFVSSLILGAAFSLRK